MGRTPPSFDQLVAELLDPRPGYGRLSQSEAEQMARMLRRNWTNREVFEVMDEAEPSGDPGTTPPYLDPVAEELGVSRDSIATMRSYDPIRDTFEAQLEWLQNPPSQQPAASSGTTDYSDMARDPGGSEPEASSSSSSSTSSGQPTTLGLPREMLHTILMAVLAGLVVAILTREVT